MNRSVCPLDLSATAPPRFFFSMASSVDNSAVKPNVIEVIVDQIEQPTPPQEAQQSDQVVSTDLLDQPPEILVAYLAGEPEAVAAIELLREAQRVWNQRKNSSTTTANTTTTARKKNINPCNSKFLRRYSHDDLRIAYTNISARLMTLSPLDDAEPSTIGSDNCDNCQRSVDSTAKQPKGNAASAVPLNYRRRASALPETSTTSRYIKNPAVRNKRAAGGIGSSQIKKLSDATVDGSVASITTGGGGGGELTAVTAAVAAEAIRSEQLERRRASSKASAIFIVSGTSKDAQLVGPEDEDDGSPEGRRRRRTISIIATVGAFLLVLSILLVTVTLRLASHIDDIGKSSAISFWDTPDRCHRLLSFLF